MSKAKPYEMELKVPHGIRPKIPKEGDFRAFTALARRDTARASPPAQSEIVEGHLIKDHVHMCISIPPKYAVLTVVGYMKGKSAIVIALPFEGKRRNYAGSSFGREGTKYQ